MQAADSVHSQEAESRECLCSVSIPYNLGPNLENGAAYFSMGPPISVNPVNMIPRGYGGDSPTRPFQILTVIATVW